MLAVKEAARQIGVSRSKVYELVARRSIAHYRVGGKILIDPADLDAYKQGCKVETAKARPTAGQPSAFKQLDPIRLAEAWRKQGVL